MICLPQHDSQIYHMTVSGLVIHDGHMTSGGWISENQPVKTISFCLLNCGTLHVVVRLRLLKSLARPKILDLISNQTWGNSNM